MSSINLVHLKFRNLKYPDIFGYFCKFETILVEIQLKFSLKFEIQPKSSKISKLMSSKVFVSEGPPDSGSARQLELLLYGVIQNITWSFEIGVY